MEGNQEPSGKLPFILGLGSGWLICFVVSFMAVWELTSLGIGLSLLLAIPLGSSLFGVCVAIAEHS